LGIRGNEMGNLRQILELLRSEERTQNQGTRWRETACARKPRGLKGRSQKASFLHLPLMPRTRKQKEPSPWIAWHPGHRSTQSRNSKYTGLSGWRPKCLVTDSDRKMLNRIEVEFEKLWPWTPRVPLRNKRRQLLKEPVHRELGVQRRAA
jgi:hypothetical protein